MKWGMIVAFLNLGTSRAFTQPLDWNKDPVAQVQPLIAAAAASKSDDSVIKPPPSFPEETKWQSLAQKIEQGETPDPQEIGTAQSSLDAGLLAIHLYFIYIFDQMDPAPPGALSDKLEKMLQDAYGVETRLRDLKDRLDLNVRYVTTQNYNTLILQSTGTVLIDYFALFTYHDQVVEPILKDLSQGFKGKVRFAQVNTEIAKDLAQQAGITTTPTFVFLRDGKEFYRITKIPPTGPTEALDDDQVKKWLEGEIQKHLPTPGEN